MIILSYLVGQLVLHVHLYGKGITSCQDRMRRGAAIKIGDGQSTSIWSDPRIPGDPNLLRVPMDRSLVDLNMKAAELINEEQRSWNLDLPGPLFSEFSVEFFLHFDIQDRFSHTNTAVNAQIN